MLDPGPECIQVVLAPEKEHDIELHSDFYPPGCSCGRRAKCSLAPPVSCSGTNSKNKNAILTVAMDMKAEH